MRKFIFSLCAGIIGLSALSSPAGAVEIEPGAAVPPGQVEEVEHASRSSAGSSGADDDLLMVGLSSVAVIGAALGGGAWAVQEGLLPNPLPGLLPSPTPVRPAPAPQSPAPEPVLFNCEAPGVVRPDLVRIACGNGWSNIENITWHSWNQNSASGSGRYYWNTCRPSCAAGNYEQEWVDFTLGGVTERNGQRGFTRAYFGGREYHIGPWDLTPEFQR